MLFAASAGAQVIPVGDPSFEASALTACNFIQGFNNSPWTISGSGGAWRPQPCWDMTAPDGLHVAYISGGIMAQTLTTHGEAGQTYTLSVMLGRRNHPCCPFSDTTMSLSAGARDLGSRLVSSAEAPPAGQWARFSLTVTAPGDLASGQPLIVRFSTPSTQTDLDDVRLEFGAGCRADFNGDGFVTGDDFDAYVVEFIAGNAAADFNGDGFVTGDDFDLFVVAFVAGC